MINSMEVVMKSIVWFIAEGLSESLYAELVSPLDSE